MINIRYHIVSITAVFLALGIGVALGSTFLDGATVDVLNKNISSAEARIKDANTKIDALEASRDAANARDTGLVILGTDRLLGDQLTDVPVLVVAEPGLADDEVAGLVSVLDRSGADLRGTLALSDRLAFAGKADDALATQVGLDAGASAAELRKAVTAQLTEALAAAGAPAAESDDGTSTTSTTAAPTTTVLGVPTTAATTTTTTATDGQGGEGGELDGTQPAIVTALLDRGYLDLTPGPGYTKDDPILEHIGYRYVFIGSAAPKADDTAVLLRLLPTTDEATIPAVVVAATTDPTLVDPAPTVVADVRSSDALAGRYTTIDDVDTFAGLAATVFSVADLGSAPVGHYGQADGATAVLPTPP